jgi:hypothetical protein
LDTAEDGPLSEARIIGTLLQVLNGGEPVRKMGPPIDYLNAGDGGVSQGTTSTPLSMHGESNAEIDQINVEQLPADVYHLKWDSINGNGIIHVIKK